MKTLHITLALIMTLFFQTTLSATQSYIYNVEKEGKNISSQTIYKTDPSGRYLILHLRYDFTYDMDNHPTQKDVLQWDEITQQWEMLHSFCYHYETDHHTATIEYARWDRNTQNFEETSEKTVYSYDILGKPTLYEVYKLDPENKEWQLTHSHSIPDNPLVLYANN